MVSLSTQWLRKLAILICCVSALALKVHAADVVLMDFTAKWCQPCQQLNPILGRFVQEGLIVRQIDADKEASLVQRWQVTRLPTLILISDGKEVDRIVGTIDESELRARLGKFTTLTAPATAKRSISDAATGFASDRASTSRDEDLPLMSLARQETKPSDRSSSGPFPPLHAGNGSEQASTTSNTNTVSQATFQRPAASAAPAQAVNPMDATVRIRVDENNSIAFGTGTIIDQHGEDVLVMTCGHLFRNVRSGSSITVEVWKDGGSVQFPASVVDYECDQIDIGLLTFRSPSPVAQVVLRPAGESLQEGETVFSIGCDHGSDPSRRDSRISKLNRYLGPPNVEVSGAPVQGRSGGGLFDSQSRLIGVCYAADGELDEGLYSAPAVIYQQLSKLGLERLYQNKTASPAVQFANHESSTPSSAKETPALTFASPHADGFPDTLPHRPQSQISGTSTRLNESPNSNLTVIVRDADGNQRVLEIPDAPASLVQALQLQAMGTTPTAIASNTQAALR